MADGVHIRVDDPDDPLGPPAYDGPADKASTVLAPGTYTAVYDNGRTFKVRILADGTTTLVGD